jgi:hypothetical protein
MFTADPSARDSRGDTPLHAAVRLGHAAIVGALLGAYAPRLLARELDARGDAPLHTAVRALAGGEDAEDAGEADGDRGSDAGSSDAGTNGAGTNDAGKTDAQADAGRGGGGGGGGGGYQRGALVRVEREGHTDRDALRGMVRRGVPRCL